jgi:hypothetical protein
MACRQRIAPLRTAHSTPTSASPAPGWSAIAGVLVCELGRDVWGRAEHPDEAAAQLADWERQLQELQAAINDTVITWADIEGDGPTAFVAGTAAFGLANASGVDKRMVGANE